MGGGEDVLPGDDGGAAMVPVGPEPYGGRPRDGTGGGLEAADDSRQSRLPRVPGRLVHEPTAAFPFKMLLVTAI